MSGFATEVKAIGDRYKAKRSEATAELNRIISELRKQEDAEVAALRTKYGKGTNYREPWKIRCEQLDLSFEMPSYSDNPRDIPGLDYPLTDLSAASHSFNRIWNEARKRGFAIDKGELSWTITTPKGEVTHWDEISLAQQTAMEVAAG